MNDVTIIKPARKWEFINWKELWEFRELILTLIQRDVTVRYRQTIIGIAWAVMQPLLTMVIFSFFFGKLAKIPSEGVPYPVFSYAGLLLWIYFSNSLGAASNSMVGNSGLITKIYFPRIIIPIVSVLTPLVDYVAAFSIMLGLMFYFHVPIHPSIALAPLATLLTAILVSGVGFWLSALNVRYRDVRYILPFFLQLWLFVTPVIYPTSVAERFRLILGLNPITGFIELHRAAILQQPIPIQSLLQSIALTGLLFITGVLYFKRTEQSFADVI